MADQSEQIEAKLAAYIDGELSGGDREEIEKHLAANPSHLALVTDLMWQKQMVKGLPRELAPVNMNEDLQSQLERDVLLSGGDPAEEAKAVAGRIHRWPQIFSTAAILAMTAGLGAVVYSVLPGKRPAGIAIEPQATPIVQPEKIDGRRLEDLAKAGADDTMKRADQPAPPLPADGGGGRGAAFTAGRGSAGKTGAGEAEEALVTVGDPETLVLAISGDDLDGARGQVVRYLAANQLAYRAAGPEGSSLARLANGADVFNRTAGEVLAQSSVLYKRQLEAGATEAVQESRLTQAREGELSLDPAVREAVGPVNEKADEGSVASKLAARPDAVQPVVGPRPSPAAGQSGQDQGSPPPAPATVAQADRRSRSIRPSAMPAPAEAPAQNAAPDAATPAPAGELESVKAKESEPVPADRNDSLLAEAQRFATDQKIELSAVPGDAAGRVIVVRNINGRQVQELASRLKQVQGIERAPAKDPAAHWQVALFTPDQQRKLLGEQQAVALADQIVRTADSLESQQLAAWSRGRTEQRDGSRGGAETTGAAVRSDPIGPVIDAAPPLRGGVDTAGAPATNPAAPQITLAAPATRPTFGGGVEQFREQPGIQSRADAGSFALNGVVPASERAYFNCVIVLHSPAEVMGVNAGAAIKPATRPSAAGASAAPQTQPAR